MISAGSVAPAGRRFTNVVLPTRRRRWRVDALDVALPRREPGLPAIAIVGIVQATGALSFDFGPTSGPHRRS